MNILKIALLSSTLLVSGAAWASNDLVAAAGSQPCVTASNPAGNGHVDTASNPAGNGHVDSAQNLTPPADAARSNTAQNLSPPTNVRTASNDVASTQGGCH